VTSYAPQPGQAHAGDALRRFTDAMDRAVAATGDTAARAAAAASLLPDLLAHPEAIGARHRVPSHDGYQQHVVHVHPDGCYSLVALVWRPGQATPIHDHRCWCVVGVLEGEEDEERFHLVDHDGRPALVLTGNERQAAGSVCTLVPPQENIHRVSSAAPTGVTVSLHVYGDDIAQCGSSINQVFDEAMLQARAEVPDATDRLSWREHA
jgi:predicted metal-dependent enzyme (double-stranded beta helix superfamily)